MSAANQDDFSFSAEDRFLQIKAGMLPVLKGDVLAVELNIAAGGVSGATIPQLVNPIPGISSVSGPIVVALENGKAGDRINVRWQGPCKAKMAGAPVEPYCPLLILAFVGDSPFRRFRPNNGGGAETRNAVFGWTTGRLANTNQLVDVMLSGGHFVGFIAV